MTRQTNMNEARLIEENERWKTHWVFLRSWMEEWNDSQIPSRRRQSAVVLKVMDELRPEMVIKGFRIESNRDEGIELSDGGIILYPDNNGTIERYDGTGDRMETRNPDHPDYEEWNRLMGDKAWTGDEQ